ncbi:hypothetical protein [Nocardia rhamnosiphila]
MPSNALRAFDKNRRDIESLLEIAMEKDYQFEESSEVVSKAAIVVIASFWEAYCEDIAAEGLGHLVANIVDINDLPKGLRKALCAAPTADVIVRSPGADR